MATMRKKQSIGLHQTFTGYVVRRYAGKKLISEKSYKTLKAADKAVVAAKRIALKQTKTQPDVYGIAKKTKATKKATKKRKTTKRTTSLFDMSNPWFR